MTSGRPCTSRAKWVVVPGSSFYRGDVSLGRGLVWFAFPKRLQTLEEARRRLAAGG